jgi:prepilin-type N-terminal cleavage/methylation domain-containing protein
LTLHDRGEEGLTLIELLITLMVMGVAFVVVLGGMGTTMTTSALHRQQARAETEVRRYAEFVKQARFSSTCSYSKVGFTENADFTYADPVTTATLDNVSATTTCAAATLHVVQLRVSSNIDTNVRESVDIVKRKLS